jgi:UDP-N-acetylmuramate--alanine ligase
MDDFARAFHQADTVHLIDIYPASESPIEGVSSQVLAEKLQVFGHRGAVYSGDMDAGIESVLQAAESGDAIVTLGAGSVSQAGDRIVEKLRSGR